MNYRLRLASVLVFLACVAMPGLAHAHPSGTVFRIGLGIPALSVEHYPEPETTTVTYGLTPSTLGLHLGVQVTPSIGLAVHVLGGGISTSNPLTNIDLIFFSVAPRFEYMFYPHETVAPYLGAEAGIQITGDPDANLSDTLRAGGFFGLHIFATTTFSIDTEAAVNFLYDLDRDQAGVRGMLYLSFTGWLN